MNPHYDQSPLETEPSRSIKPDDDRLAREIAPGWREYFQYFNAEWKEWAGGVWHGRDESEMRVRLRSMLRSLRYEKQFEVAITQGRINGLLQMLEDDLYTPDRHITQRQADAAHYINLRNGLFNLNTMCLEPHNPELFFTNQLDFDYDPDALCPTWTAYLRKSLVIPGSAKTDFKLVQLVEQALAYSMTARTDLKASFWLVGAPDSGKSTFIALIRALMGSLHGTIDLNQLATNRFLLSGVVGKRVVTFTEGNSSSVLPDAIYKAMVGGEDEVYADVKNKPGISFKPMFKVWWAMNEQPRISDRSGATFNRLQIIPFNRSIPRAERIGNLVQLLSNERAGIFNDLMFQYQILLRTGHFVAVEQSAAQRDEYRLENDTEQTFIQEACIVDPSERAQSLVLYDHYRGWCERNGFKPKNHNQIRGEWRRLGFESYKSDGKVFYRGLRIVQQ